MSPSPINIRDYTERHGRRRSVAKTVVAIDPSCVTGEKSPSQRVQRALQRHAPYQVGMSPLPYPVGLSYAGAFIRTLTAAGVVWTLLGRPVSEQQKRKLDAMNIPPAWTDVRVSTDKTTALQVAGFDAFGRLQRQHSTEVVKGDKRKRLVRAKEFSKELRLLQARIKHDAQRGVSEAQVLRLAEKSLLRLGAQHELRGLEKAYGITTLEGRHVRINGDVVTFDFPAAKGRRLIKRIILAPDMAAWLKDRVKAAPAIGQLFPEVDGSRVSGYLKSISAGKFSYKDLRSFQATACVIGVIAPYAGMVLTRTARRSLVKRAVDKASALLGTTSAVSRAAYIDPAVWGLLPQGLPDTIKKGGKQPRVLRSVRRVGSI